MTALDSLKKAIAGDEGSEIIKSGTLATTRGTGVVAIALVGVFLVVESLDFGPWKDASSAQQLTFVLGAGAIWAVVAGADSIARGISTANARTVVTLPPGLVATKTDGQDEPGWAVVAIDIGNGKEGSQQYLLSKGGKAEWLDSTKLVLETAVK